MAGVNRDETAYFYPCKLRWAHFGLKEVFAYLITLFSSFGLVIVSAHYRGDSAYYEKYLIPQFLESATPFKGQLKERVIPEILFEYFNGIVPSNVTNVGKRFINVSWDQIMTCLYILI